MGNGALFSTLFLLINISLIHTTDYACTPSPYTQICDISFVDGTYACDECLNLLFTDYELEATLHYSTKESDANQYRQRAQHAFYSSLIYLLTDETDQFRKAIDTECDCIDGIKQHIGILIMEQFMADSRRRMLLQTSMSYTMSIAISTDLEIINAEIVKLFHDERFKYLFAANMLSFDDSFEVNSISLASDIDDNAVSAAADRQIMRWITIVVICILGVVLIIATIGTVQMYAYDVTIYVTGILLFGLYTWDFYSDILFSYEVWISYAVSTREQTAFLLLFVACLIFLILPIIASILSLFRFQDKWREDASIGDHVTGWNRDWSTYLLMLTILSGSSFAAVNILNSRVFGHPLFCMGLSYRHLKKFENQRLWGVILSENIPQLIIQAIFFWKSSQQFSNILILAFVSSLLSIIVALIDIYNNKRLFGQFNKGDDYQTILKVPVISHEVAGKQWILALATHRFNEVFSKIIGVDKYAIEVDLPSPDQNGLVINFSVRTVDISPKEIVDAMIKAQRNGAMAKFIQEAWNLEKAPLLGRLKFEQIGRKQTDLAVDSAIEMVNPLSSDGKKLVFNDDVTTLSYDGRESVSTERQRTSTVEAKPYDAIEATTKHKLKEEKKKKKRSKTSMIPEDEVINVREMRIESEPTLPAQTTTSIYNAAKSYSNTTNDTDVMEVVLEDIPQAQTQLSYSKSESTLPRQKTGAHTKKMRDIGMSGLAQSNKITKKEIATPISSQGQTIKDLISNDPQTQFRHHVQRVGAAPSSPELYGHNNSNNNSKQAAYHHHHGHAQTYHNMPTNMIYDINNNNINNYGMQQEFQQQAQYNYNQYGGYAASATNLNNNYNYNAGGNHQQHYQQNPQMHSASTMDFAQNENYNNNRQEEVEHSTFVPPSPQNEVGKYMQYKHNRQLRGEEKKMRQQKEKQERRLEKAPNLSKIESMNEMDINRQQWTGNNNKYANNRNNNRGVQFAKNIGNHNEEESNNMQQIVNEMQQSSTNQY